eukprot:SAG22_NODE_20_length_32168_cov_40.859241_6_plen_136_part_00
MEMGLCLLPKDYRRPKEPNPTAFCYDEESTDCFLFKQTHPLDLSLAIQGILLYSTYFLVISYKKPWPLREALFLMVGIGGACFSCYLLYVIKMILKEFCIVCFSFHCCNFAMLVLSILEYRNPSVGGADPKLAKD